MNFLRNFCGLVLSNPWLIIAPILIGCPWLLLFFDNETGEGPGLWVCPAVFSGTMIVLLGPPFFTRLRIALLLSYRGVKAEAVVIAVGNRHRSMRNLTYEFSYLGKIYRRSDTLHDIPLGEHFHVLVDPKNPNLHLCIG